MLVLIGTIPVLAVNSYLALLTVAAWRRTRAAQDASSQMAPSNSFAVLIPAHDEAGTIAETIESIARQEYPPELYSVQVVADNCTDGTAEIARRHGAEVHERFDPTARGKGPALAWLVERLENRAVDAIVILDADTTMSPSFLGAMDRAITDGGSAWQAYYTVRDAESSPATALRSAALALRHYVRPLGRTAIGGSCGLFGNGMVFRRELLTDRRFSSHLTEDVEFQLDLLLDGARVGFVPQAVVEAEMPTTLEAARTQNERWELGRLQLARSYVPKLLREALRAGTLHRAALADAALDQLVPPLSVLAAGTTLTTVVATALPLAGRSRGSRTAAALAWLAMFGFALHVVEGFRLARVPRSAYRALLHAPHLVLWKVTLWVRVLLRPDQVTWRRTVRNDPHPAA